MLTSEQLELQPKLEAANVDRTSFLATDYLNHFNEVMMLVEMLPDMPDMYEEVQHWKPKTYAEHFRDSALCSSDLIVAAYEIAPPPYRQAFDALVDELNVNILAFIQNVAAPVEAADPHRLRMAVAEPLETMQRLSGKLNGIIHGHFDGDWAEDTAETAAAGQDQIDDLFAESDMASQDEIDALFD